MSGYLVERIVLAHCDEMTRSPSAMEKTTSPEIIVLTLAAAGAGFYAFWLSIRQDLRFDRLIIMGQDAP